MTTLLRNLVVTLNNYTEEERLNLLSEETFSYIILGKETGDSGTPHLQGYIELKKRTRMSTIKRINDRMHIEKRMGTAKQADKYCRKDGDFETRGVMKQQGKRTDIINLRKRVKAGESMATIIDDCPNYNIMRMCEKIASYLPVSHIYEKKTVYWLYGKTGTGKTRLAMESCPEEETWHASTGQWFDGYHGQKYAILDEFRAKNWTYDLILKLLDGYQLRVPIKGGFTIWRPEIVYITAPLHPERIYHGQLEYHGGIDQLTRRITEIRCMGEEPENMVTVHTDHMDNNTVVHGSIAQQNSNRFD